MDYVDDKMRRLLRKSFSRGRTARTAAAAALSLVFVLLQVGRCQIRDTSANLHVFARSRMCLHTRLHVFVRRYMIPRVQRRARSTKPWWAGVQPIGPLVCRFGRQICSPAAIARCAGPDRRAARCLEKNREPRSPPAPRLRFAPERV